MELILSEDMFVNNRYTISYGNREALFTIVDEEFYGHNRLGRINRITILVRERDETGKETGASLASAVIGLGDGVAGIRCDVPELRGKLLTRDNMALCVVELYEENE